jgi:hypothetical protein
VKEKTLEELIRTARVGVESDYQKVRKCTNARVATKHLQAREKALEKRIEVIEQICESTYRIRVTFPRPQDQTSRRIGVRDAGRRFRDKVLNRTHELHGT